MPTVNVPKSAADDPRPTPPQEPLPGECCESGCDPCIWDWYNQELALYREALAHWLERHPEADEGRA